MEDSAEGSGRTGEPRTAPVGGKITCKICDQPFSDARALRGHYGRAHDVDHRDWHVPSTSKECDKCGERFTRRAPIGEKIVCEICAQPFSNAFTLRRHYGHVHEVDHRDYHVATTSKECDRCGVHFSNLSKHRRTCRGTLTPVGPTAPRPLRPDRATTPHPLGDAPVAVNTGGKLFTAKWTAWIPTLYLDRNTARVYTGKLKHIITYLEATVAFFRMDHLLYPLDFGVRLPSITPMKRCAQTEGERKHVACTYKYVCQLALELFDQRYTGDSRYSQTDRTNYRNQLSIEMNTCTSDLKHINKRAKGNTKRKQARQMEDPNDLTFNDERMEEVARYVMYENRTVRRMFRDLTVGSPGTIRRRYTEVELRNLLMSLILASGGGLRPNAVSHMQVGELLSARESEGTVVVLVTEHKCFNTHGPQAVPLALDGLHKACQVFLETFRKENDKYLFQTHSGNAPEIKHSRDWLRDKILVDFLTPQEIMSLRPGTWRKAYSNWAHFGPDPEMRKISTEVMCHSEEVNKSHYLKTKRGEAARFGLAMLHRIRTRKITSDILKTALEKACRIYPWVGPAYQRLARGVGGGDEALRVLLDGVREKQNRL